MKVFGLLQVVKEYVIPDEKRRDALRWGTRVKMNA